MKELTIEEKYNAAIEQARKELKACGNLDCDAARQIFRLFPELKENEDERIRKALLQTLQNRDKYCISDTFGEVNVKDAIAWLEKQGEQKHTDKVEPESYFYCKYGGTIPLCSDCKRNCINSPFKREEITTWHRPSKSTHWLECEDYIACFEKQGEQSNEKLEPMFDFKVG